MEFLAQQQISWKEILLIVDSICSHQIIDSGTQTKVETHIRRGLSATDTIAFIQILCQFYNMSRHLINDDTTTKAAIEGTMPQFTGGSHD